MLESFYHVTVLSNLARAWDKYSDRYCKSGIHESRFPNEFYLLRSEELQVGICKAKQLLEKLRIPGDRLLVLETRVSQDQLKPNLRTGLGQYVAASSIAVNRFYFLDSECRSVEPAFLAVEVEDAMAMSLALHQDQMLDFQCLRPRTFSVLPIARGCQANCQFCFSEASVSAIQEQSKLSQEAIDEYARKAAERGAERMVITGGGEPGLVPHEQLLQMFRIGQRHFGKVVLISNGHHLGTLNDEFRKQRLIDYADAGLNVLAISRHHSDDAVNSEIMRLQINAAAVISSWKQIRDLSPTLRVRLICVLQQTGVNSVNAIGRYLDWAVAQGVPEVCFKELYVSTSIESVFHSLPSNQWSREHRVPLSTVLRFAAEYGFVERSRLPWGAPVFEGVWRGELIRIAAYTEPSLFWERTHGVARSWNLMADGRCLASLEDRASEALIEKVVA
jgi:molybdenum cofactor biosynthesis enzyme MoaA